MRQARPGYLSFNIVSPFWFCGAVLNTTVSGAFIVGASDGVVRTNIYLRPSWSGRRFHFSVSVSDTGSVISAHVAHVTVRIIDSLCYFLKSSLIFKIFALLQSVCNLLKNAYDVTHLNLGMLLHYLGKLKIQSLQIF